MYWPKFHVFFSLPLIFSLPPESPKKRDDQFESRPLSAFTSYVLPCQKEIQISVSSFLLRQQERRSVTWPNSQRVVSDVNRYSQVRERDIVLKQPSGPAQAGHGS